MSTSIWPPIGPDQLIKEEELSLHTKFRNWSGKKARELEWLLSSLQDTFASLKLGLEECATLLAPENGPSTLALSSQRSESLKGFVTRIGTRVVKGEISIRLATLPPPKNSQSPLTKLSISTAPSAPTLVLSQLTSVRTLINASLDIIDVSRWTGDAKNAPFIAGQLKLLYDNIQEAKGTLKGGSGAPGWKEWWEDVVEDDTFAPPLPPNLSFHLAIAEAALCLHVRTLELTSPHHTGHHSGHHGGHMLGESLTGYNLRERLVQAVSGSRPPSSTDASELQTWKGEEVKVRERVKVESQDPALLSVMAKLSALEHSVAMSRHALATVMDVEE